MTWEESLEIVVAHTRHEAYRANCADSHPQHEVWRRKMVAKAQALAGTPAPEYPPFLQQAGNAIRAAGRVVAAVAQGEPVRVPDEVHESRLATCRACEQYDAAQGRCKACGCGGMKLRLATERCPLSKWERYDGPTDR